MSFQHAAFPCLSLHGTVWIVTLCSQCNHTANSQTCAAARRPCFCLSKQTQSIFDVRFVWVSNNKQQREGLESLGIEQRLSSSIQIIHKMNETLLKSTRLRRGICWTKRWWWIRGRPHIPERHLLYIYGEVILFTDVQSDWLSRAWYYRSVEGRLRWESICWVTCDLMVLETSTAELPASHLILPMGL